MLRLVRELADARGLDAVCVTFDRHPAEVVRPESAPKLLTTPEQKLELLDATGYLDRCFVLHFDEARSREPAEDFVREVLVDGARAAARRRRRRLPLRQGPRRQRARCSSRWAPSSASRSRASGSRRAPGGADLLVDAASASCSPRATSTARAALLGRPHEVRGHGRWRATAGAASSASRPPTSRCPARMLPPRRRHLRRHVRGPPTASSGPTAISLGRRPTFYEHAEMSLLEAYVLDFDGDLYGAAR